MVFFARSNVILVFFWTHVTIATNAIIWTQPSSTRFFWCYVFSSRFWLVIMICLRYSYVFLWFLVGFHGFSRYFHAFVFSTLSLSTVCNDKQKNVTCQQLTILFRLPGCFNVNSTLASILSLPIVNDKITIKKINSNSLNVQAPRMLQCQRCSGRRLSSFKRTPSGNCRIFTVRRKNWWK